MTRRNHKLALLIVLTMTSAMAFANPDGAQVVHGNASFTRPDANTLNITNSRNAIINWQRFNIDGGQTTRFIQPDRNSAVLNRVLSNNPSQIHGNLRSNGQVFLINQHGLMVGAGATIDTAGFFGSTLNLTDEDFLNGNLNFSGGGLGGIDNQGYIHAGPDGNVVLIAPDITNGGVIEVDGGNVILAAGEAIRISSLNDGSIEFDVQAPDNTILNLGTIIARQGAARLFAGNLKHSGAINATGLVRNADGTISLVAQDKVEVSGSVTAEGGKIEVLGDQVTVKSGALVDTSGTSGGGVILLGGDRQGLNTAIRNAISTTVEAGAEVRADAIVDGDGGKVIVFAENDVHVHGEVSARGGSQGGDGGFIETSGLEVLDISSVPDATAPAGDGGEWLIDPNNIAIVAGAVIVNVTNTPPTYDTTDDTAQLGVDLVTGALDGGQSVTITTTNAGGDTEDGIISLDAPLEINNTTGSNTLTLIAQNNILINQPIQESTDLGDSLNLVLTADNDIVINSAIDFDLDGDDVGDGGDITMQAGRSILVNADIDSDGGKIDLIANDFAAIDANRGLGDADLAMAAGTTLDAGPGNIELSIEFGTISATGGDMTLANLVADHVILRIKPPQPEVGSDILREASGGTITALSLFVDHDDSDEGTIGTQANPLDLVVDNVGMHIHGTTDAEASVPGEGIYVTAQGRSGADVTVGNTCYGNGDVGCDTYLQHTIRGFETLQGGAIELTVTGGGGLIIVEPINAFGNASGDLTLVADGDITTAPDLGIIPAAIPIRGDSVSITSNTGDVNLNGGVGANLSASIESTGGDITVNAVNLVLTEGGADSDAIVIVDGGAGSLILGATVCASCGSPLFFDPRGNGSSDTGIADISVTSTADWNGLGDGVSWEDPLNWDISGVPIGDGVPIGNVDVTIDPGATTTIQVSSGTRYALSLSMPGDVSLEIFGATLNIGTPTTINADLALGDVVAPATLDVNGTLDIGGNLTLRFGTLNTNGAVNVGGLTLWDAPNTSSAFQDVTLSGSGAFNANGGFDLGTSLHDDTLTLNQPLIINAPSTWQDFDASNIDADIIIAGTGSITINSSVTVDLETDIPLTVTPDLTIGPAGAITMNAGTADMVFVGALNNNGAFNVNVNDLLLSGGGTHNGNFSIATNMILDTTGPHLFNAASSITGAGVVQIEDIAITLDTGSTVTPTLNVAFDGSITSTGNLTVTDFNIGTTDPSINAQVTIGGILTVNGALTLQQGGLTTAGDVVVTGLTSWNPWSTSSAFQDFTLDGAGVFVANGGFDLGANLNDDTLTLDKLLLINADSTWQDFGDFTVIVGSGSIVNNAYVAVQNGFDLPIAVPVINNVEIDKVAGGNTLAFDGGLFMSPGSFLHIESGSVTVSGGTLALNQAELTGGGTFDGAVVSTGGVIGAELNDGSSATLTITGALTLDSESYLVFDLGGTAQSSEYDLIDVGGDVSLAGTLAVFWDNGFISADTDTFDLIQTGGSFLGVFDVEFPPVGVTAYTITFPATFLQLATTTVSPNIVVWNVDTDGDWNVASNWFLAAGNRVPLATDYVVIDRQLDPTIVVTIPDASLVTVAGLQAENNLSIVGSGGLAVGGDGIITGDQLGLGGSGGLTADGSLILATQVVWNAGDLSGSGSITAHQFSGLDIDAGAGALNTSLINDGVYGSTWSGGASTGSGSLTNNGILIIDGAAGADYTVTNGFGATLTKADAATTTFSGPGVFTNNGTLQIDAGTLVLTQDATHAGSFALAAGTTLQLAGTQQLFGVLSGSGTVDAAAATLTTAGVISPGGVGGQIGTLTIDGDVANLALIQIEIQSTGVAGTDYDLLAITGQADLQGSLVLLAINGYTVTESDSITPLTFGSSSSNSLTIVPIGIETPVPSYTSGSLDLLLTFVPTSIWNGGGVDDAWNTVANWTGGLPGAGDNAVIPFGSSFTITIAAAANAGTLSLAADATITQSAGTLTLAGDSTLSGDYNLNGGSYVNGGTVTLDNSTLTIAGGTLSGGTLTSIGTGSVAFGGGPNNTFSGVLVDTDITILNGQIMRVTGGLTINAGRTITLASTGSGTNLIIDNSQTISGAGSIVFGGSSSQNFLNSGVGGPGTLTIGAGISISGSGTVGGNAAGYFVNNLGTITANVGDTLQNNQLTNGAGGSLVVDGGTMTLFGAWDNLGSMTVDNAGSFNLGGPFPSSALAGGGYVNVDGVSTTTITNTMNISGSFDFTDTIGDLRMTGVGEFANGTLTSSGTATLVIDAVNNLAQFDNVTLDMDLTVGNGGTLRILNNFTINTGRTLTLASTGVATTLQASNPQSIIRGGGGTAFIQLGGNGVNNFINSLGSSGTLTIGAGIDVSGGGFVGTNTAGFVTRNNGSISVGAGETINLRVVENFGSLIAAGGGAFNYDSSTIDNDGVIDIGAGSSFTGSSNFTNNPGGVIRGSGSFDLGVATLFNDSTLQPGGPGATGILTILGNVTMGSTADLQIEVDEFGTVAGTNYDQLLVSGAVTATLAGALDLSLLGGNPVDGNYRVVDVTGGGSLAGTFDAENLLTGFSPVNYGASFAELAFTAGALFWDDGGLDGDWNNNLNWVGDVVPTIASDASIGIFNVTIGAAANANTLSLAGGGSVTLTGGTFTIASASTLAGDLAVSGGTLTGNGDVTVDGSFDWTGGSLAGNGQLTTTAAGTINQPSGLLLSRNWINSGTLTWQFGNVAMNSTRTFTNTGIFNANAGAIWTMNTGSETFDNQNVVFVTGASAFAGGGSFDNSGNIVISPGITLSLSTGPSSDSGGWSVGTGAVAITGGARTLDDGFSATSTGGSLTLSGGTLNVNTTSPLVLPATLAVSVSGGTLTGDGDLEIGGNFSWNFGSLAGNGLLTTTGTGAINQPSGLILSRDWTNDGTLTWQSGNLTINSTRTFTNTGTFNADASALFTLNSGAETFDNQGFFILRSNTAIGGGGSGSFQQSGGQLDLGGFILTNTPTLQVSGGEVGGSGTITGDLVNNGGTIEPGGSGAIGALNIGGDFTNTTGTVVIEIDSDVAAAGTSYDLLAVTGTADLNDTLTLQVIGTYTVTDNDILSPITYAVDAGGTFSTINPIAGELVTPTYGATDLSLLFNIVSGDLWVGVVGGGDGANWLDDLNWQDGTAPTLGDSATILDGFGYSVTIAGAANANTLSLGADATLTIASGTFTLANDSTLDGALVLQNGTFVQQGQLDIGGTFTWNGGTLIGAGTTRLLGTATANLTGTSNNMNLDGHALALQSGSTTTYSSTFLPLQFDNGATLTNAATVNMTATVGINALAGSGTIANNGSFTYNNAGGSPTIAVPFDNGGTLDVQAGTLSLNGGGTSGGVFNIDGTLSLGGTHAISDANIGGTGTLVNTGTVTIDDPGVVAVYDVATTQVNSGTLTLNHGATVPNVTLSSGTLSVGSSLDISGNLTWNGGTLIGAGTTRLLGTATANLTGTSNNMNLDGHALALQSGSTTTYSSTFLPLQFDNGATLTNAATVNMTATVGINALAGSGTIANNGSFTYNNAGGSPTIAVPFDNGGTLDVQAGTLSLNGGGTSGGIFNIDGTLSLGGTHAISDANIGGAGTLINTGTVTIDDPGVVAVYAVATTQVNSGTLTLNHATTVPNVTLSNGTLLVGSTLDIGGTFTWNGGTLIGAGTTRLLGTATANLTGTSNNMNLDGHALALQSGSTTTYSSTFLPLQFDNGATLTNAATVNMTATVGINALAGSGTIANNGSFTYNNAGGSATIAVPFDNGGTLDVQAGTLSLNGGGTSGGVFNIDGTLSLGGTHAISDANIGGTGTLVNTGTVTVDDPGVVAVYDVATTQVNSGTLTLNHATTVATVALASGIFDVGSTLGISSGFTWSGGILRGAGITQVLGTASANLTGTSNNLDLDGHTLELQSGSTATYSSTFLPLRFSNSAALTNAGTLNLTGTVNINQLVGGIGAIDNTGAVNADSSLSIGVDFNNDGTVFVDSASGGSVALTLSAAVTGTGDWDLGDGDDLLNATLALNGGALSGSGSVFGDVTNNGGSIEPGGAGAAGLITINGDYAQDSTASLLIEVDDTGTQPGADHDQLIVNTAGTVSIDGTLVVSLLNGAPLGGIRVLDISGGATLATTFLVETIDPAFNLPTYGATFVDLVLAGAISWLGGVDNLWTTDGNWSGGSAPLSSDDVVIGTGFNLTVSGTADASTLSLAAGSSITVTDGGFLMVNNPTTLGGDLTIDGVAATVLLPVGDLDIGSNLGLGEGLLDVAGDITVTGLTTWTTTGASVDFSVLNAGNFNANGGFDIGGSGVGDTLTLSKTLLLNAASAWGGDSYTINGGVTIVNFATLIVSNSGLATVNPGFDNTGGGTLIKTVGGTLSLDGGLINDGTIDVQAGTVATPTGFVNDGTIDVSGFGSVFDASATSFTNNPGGLLQGVGTLVAPADGTGLLNQGTIQPGDVNTIGQLNLTGDFTNATGGNLVLDLQAPLPDPTQDRLQILGQAFLDGTLTLNAVGGYTVGDGHQFNPVSYFGGAVGSFATIMPIGGETVTPVYNPSPLLLTLNLGAPTFVFDNGAGNLAWNDPLNWSSNLLPSIGDAVSIGAFNVTIAAAATANTLSLAAGGRLTISGGGLTLAGNSTLDGRLVLQGGTLALGGTTLTQNGRFDWSGTSTISNGVLTMPAAARFNITGGAANTLLNVVANIAAPTAYSGGNLVLSSSTFNNSGDFDFQGNRLVNGVGTAVFNSQDGSTLTRSSGTGVAGFLGTTTVTSLGNVAVQSGTLDLRGTTTVNLGANDVLSSGASGTLIANVTNNGGAIRPGGAGAVGQLSIQGNYTNSSGALEVEINGATTNDVLAVTGTTNFGAAAALSVLDVSYLAYVPSVGESHTFITCTIGCSTGGGFGTLNQPGGITHSVAYDSPGGQVRLVVDSVSFAWIGPSGGDWGNGANWSFGSAPDATIDVVLPGLDVTISGAATANSLTIDPGGVLTIAGAGDLSLAGTLRVRSGATLDNSGTLAVTVLTTVNGSYTQNTGANTTLAGLTVGGAFGHGGGSTTVAGTALFAGSLGVSGGTLILSGASAALNGPFDMTAGTLRFGTGVNTIGGSNNLWQGGTLRSTTGQQTLALQAGATLQLQGAATKTLRDIRLDMSQGDVNLFGSGNLVLTNAVIDNTDGTSFHSFGNGSLTGDATSQFINNGGLFENVSGASQIAVDFVNNATSQVRVLSGSLTLLDTDLADQAAYSTALPGTLGFAAPRTLTGSLVNAGTLAAIGPTTLTLPSSFSNTGNVTLDQATLDLNGQTLTLPAGKLLSGRGTIQNGQVVNNGGVVLVGGLGQLGGLTLEGDYTHNPGSAMVIEVFNNGNTNQTITDTFTVTSAGNTTLNGGALVIGFTSNSAGLVLADVSPLQLANGATGQFGRVIDAGGNILGFRFSGGVLTILGVTPKTPAALIDDLVGFIQNKEEIREIIESNESLAQIVGDEIARRREQEEEDEEDSSLICTPGA